MHRHSLVAVRQHGRQDHEERRKDTDEAGKEAHIVSIRRNVSSNWKRISVSRRGIAAARASKGGIVTGTRITKRVVVSEKELVAIGQLERISAPPEEAERRRRRSGKERVRRGQLGKFLEIVEAKPGRDGRRKLAVRGIWVGWGKSAGTDHQQ